MHELIADEQIISASRAYQVADTQNGVSRGFDKKWVNSRVEAGLRTDWNSQKKWPLHKGHGHL